VHRNRAVTDRIAADIDALIGGFEAYAGPQIAPDAALPDAVPAGARVGARALDAPLAAPMSDADESKAPSRPPWELGDEEATAAPPAPSSPPWEDATPDGVKRDNADPSASVPEAPARQLTEAFARAAGVVAMAQAMASARGAQAARLTGWPVARLLRRRGSVPALRGGASAGRQAAEAAGQAQQSEVDNAITTFADSVGGALPKPWAASLREAARCNAGMVPRALADTVRTAAVAGRSQPPAWWRLVTLWQWLLTVAAGGGVALSAVIAVTRLTGHHKGLISEASLIPWLLTLAAALLVLGFLSAVGCKNMTVAAAERERDAAERAMRYRVSGVTHDLVLVATGREIAQYERFRRELAVASAS
jgi:hypothetical protein